MNIKELSKSFVWRLTQILFKQSTTAIMFFIATFFLSKQDMGIYNYITATLTLLVIFSDFGISTSTSRYTTLYNSKDKEKVKKIFFNTALVIVSISLILITAIFILRHRISPEYTQYILIASPMILLTPLTALLDGIYRGLKKFKQLSKITALISLLAIASSYLLVTNLGLKGAILSQVVYLLIYTAILLLLHTGYEIKIDRKIIKDVTKYAIPFGIATLGFYLFSKVNILILGQYNLLEEIATYELISKIYTVFIIPTTVLGHVLAPNVVEMFSKKQDISILFKKLLSISFVVNIFFIPLSIPLARILISIFFPIYITDIFDQIVIPISLTYAIAIPVTMINSSMLTSTGHANMMAIQNISTGIVNVVLNIYIVRIYGYVGIIWSTFVIQAISTTILYLTYYKKIKPNDN